MHGLIHIILKELVVTQFGAEKWAQIGAKLGLAEGKDAAILEMKQYPDETTVAGVVATAEVLGVTVDVALRVYGAFFVKFVHMGGHLRMLQSMGDTLEAFLRNINHLHYTLERSFRDSNFPIFELRADPDAGAARRGGAGAAPSADNGNGQGSGSGALVTTLSYSSVRGELLAPLVEGVLPALALALHQQSVDMVRHETPQQGFDATWTMTTAPLPPKDTPQEEPGPVPTTAEPAPATLRKGAAWHSIFCCSNAGAQVVPHAHSPDTATAPAAQQPANKTVDLEEMVTGLDPTTVTMLDALHERAQASGDPATVLMRGVPAMHVCAEWSEGDALDMASGFWGSNRGKFRDYARSRTVARATRFVTHSWAPPDDWAHYMGNNCSYGDVKATELATVSRDIAEQLGLDDWRRDVTFWIDKTCIPQQHSLLMVCVHLIEQFLQKCDGMVVLLSWQYFERLWCVYEWAGFLISHHPKNVEICVDAFLRPATRHLYIRSIENFSVANAKCNNEADRPVLAAKVAEYYRSTAAFEHFARSTAIGVVAGSVARKAARGDYLDEFLPWVQLARRLALHELADALETCAPGKWRQEAMGDVTSATLGAAARGWQRAFAARMDLWFDAEIAPVLERARLDAVRPEHHDAFRKIAAERTGLRGAATAGASECGAAEPETVA